MRTPNHYAGAALDRASARRVNDAWIAERLGDPATRVLLVWQSQGVVTDLEAPAIHWLDASALQALDAQPDQLVFLGEVGGAAHFALDVSHVEARESHPVLASLRFEDLRTVGPLLAREDAALLAWVRGLTHWRERHRHCGVCGASTRAAAAGHELVCTNDRCATTTYPRTDPAVIMLVHDGADRCILARGTRHPSGMHTILAGFVEPGESLEEAVAREVHEEVGVRVTDVEYHSSQPWPFPGSIMLGFHARATTHDLHVDDVELKTAGWFSRAELRRSPEDDTLRLPRRDSIARRMIEEWIAEGD
ncbi:MAG: NAD(+) diphosphatase [Chloroflexi bacterium]|nr:NAD(+) diphosphatase [Chloroflexota bacterium]MDA1003270.1 NAD(+) diphosphatase [Chloroflexota bacterium]